MRCFAASFDIRHSSFTAHSAHSRNIISGTPEIQWSEWDEYAVLGNRRMDCIGRVVTRPSDWEYRESTTRLRRRYVVAGMAGKAT
jgi:hypothetical protein